MVYYAAGAGTKFGLNLEIDIEESQYLSNNYLKAGVQILVHLNHAYPDISLLSYLVESKSFATLALSSMTLISQDDVRKVNVNQRMCFMEDEARTQS